MRFYKNLYFGAGTDRVVYQKIKDGQNVFGIYAVCVRPDSVGMFEILSTFELLKESSVKKDYGVVALAKGWTGATEAVAGIIKLWLDKHESLCGIREYYNKNSL